MAAAYPSGVKTFTTKTNKVDLVDADHVNDLQLEVVAIQTELGTDVAGSAATLKARLAIGMADSGAMKQGTSFPGSPIIGQLFYRTDTDTVHIYDGAAWDDMITGVSAGGDLTGTYPNPTIDSAKVSQAKLKTSQSEVSYACTSGATGSSLQTLPGGEYGFYPQTKCVVGVGGDQNGWGNVTIAFADIGVTGGIGSSYATYIRLGGYAGTGVGGSATTYAQQRYITASGKDYWIFMLIEKVTNKIIRAWQAPDHPCNGTNLTEEEMSHPFGIYDETKHEVVLVDNEILNELKNKITRKKSLLTLINEECEIDITSEPIYEPREIIEIDEYGDRDGEILGVFKTPDWAKIKIKNDTFTLKKRMVETLPEIIKYKKLKKKAS